MENKKFNLRAVIPLATIVVSLVYIVVGLKDYGFWKNQPTPGFFPIIIAVVLLASSIACFIQIANDKDSEAVQYNRNELMVMLGAAGIILGTFVIGLVASCLIYIFLWLKFVESGLMKMMSIGLGKQKGAESIHHQSPAIMHELVEEYGKTILENCPSWAASRLSRTPMTTPTS